jgi:hypothetical protein
MLKFPSPRILDNKKSLSSLPRDERLCLRVTTLIHTQISMHSNRYGLIQALYPPIVTARPRLNLLFPFQRATSR